MTFESFLACLVIGLGSYRVTRLIVLDSLFDEPRMWFLRRLASRPPGGKFVPPTGEMVKLRGPRLPRARIKLAEGLQCTFCVGVWITVGLAALWHYVGWSRGPIIVAGICGLQALLHSWEGE